jgi:diguanylate cyclase (GGDEF)-like protein
MTTRALEERVATLEAALAEALRLSTTDPLTELENRRGWLQAIEREDARSERHGTPSVVVIVDVDGLKSINDTRGHDAGDLLLRTCARTLRAEIRRDDTVARLGGDEFGVISTDAAAAEIASLTARIVAALGRANVPASVGACARSECSDGLTEAWRVADERMLKRKRRRRG